MPDTAADETLCPLSKLGRRRRDVRCPACLKSGKTICAREPLCGERYAHENHPTSNMTPLINVISIFGIVFYTIFFFGFGLYMLARTPGGEWLAHYCSHCQMRLVFYSNERRNALVHATDDVLEPIAQNGGRIVEGELMQTVRYWPSPLPWPAEKLPSSAIVNFSERYRRVRPTKILRIQLNDENGLPISVSDDSHSHKLFEIVYANFHLQGNFHVSSLRPRKDARPGARTTAWHLSNATLSILDNRGLSCGSAQLSPISWDVGFYFLSHTNRAIDQAVRNCNIGSDGVEFTRRYPQFLWRSTLGVLFWTIRRAADAENDTTKHAGWRVVLLDGYDRLVAMNDGNWTNALNYGLGKPDSKSWPMHQPYTPIRHNKLYLCGQFADEFIAEILTSYVALCAQLLRRMHWDEMLESET